MQMRDGECGRKPVGVEFAIRLFGHADARCRGADQQRDALRTVARDRRARGAQEAVGAEAEPGEAVVAAVVPGQLVGQGDLFDAVDAPDCTGQGRRGEIVRAQAAAPIAQRLDVRSASAPERGRCGMRGDGKRRNAAGHASNRVGMA